MLRVLSGSNRGRLARSEIQMQTTIKKLKIKDIKRSPGLQVRVAMVESAIAEYAELLQEGVKLPHPVAYHDGTNYWLADGHHTVAAAERLGRTEIECEVRQGSYSDALHHAVKANAKPGLHLTPEDRRRALELLLTDEIHGQLSDRALAEVAAVSRMTVSRVREKLGPEGARAETRVGKDGKRRKPRTRKAKAKAGAPAKPPNRPQSNNISVTKIPSAANTNSGSNAVGRRPRWADQMVATLAHKIDALWLLAAELDRLLPGVSEAAWRDRESGDAKVVAGKVLKAAADVPVPDSSPELEAKLARLDETWRDAKLGNDQTRQVVGPMIAYARERRAEHWVELANATLTEMQDRHGSTGS